MKSEIQFTRNFRRMSMSRLPNITGFLLLNKTGLVAIEEYKTANRRDILRAIFRRKRIACEAIRLSVFRIFSRRKKLNSSWLLLLYFNIFCYRFNICFIVIREHFNLFFLILLTADVKIVLLILIRVTLTYCYCSSCRCGLLLLLGGIQSANC